MKPPERTSNLEQEVKFFLKETAPLRQRLHELGLHRYQARMHEINIRFDTPDGSLTRQGQVLRLRQAGRCILTYKQPDTSASVAPARRHRETEVVVDDLARTVDLLQGLGFLPIVQYEKYREVFRREATLVMVDQLPFGDFLELEGPDLARLRAITEQLDLHWSDALQASYMGIFLAIKKSYRLSFREASFKHFAGWDPRKTEAVLSRLTYEELHDRHTL